MRLISVACCFWLSDADNSLTAQRRSQTSDSDDGRDQIFHCVAMAGHQSAYLTRLLYKSAACLARSVGAGGLSSAAAKLAASCGVNICRCC